MKLGTPFLALGILLALAGIPFAITAASCSDGTAYGKCSSANPGNYCTGDINGPALQMYPALCKCEAVAGWVQQGTGVDATCVQAKCDDGSKAGDCATTKPKVCLGGANYADNATKCGCPQGKKISANGIFCESIPCNDFDSIGTPSTGRQVFAAVTPARWAAPPAAAMMTSSPRPAAPEAYSNSRSGVRWAEMTRLS